MKILFVGDYSNLHATLAAELNSLGHTAHVISDRGLYLGSHADFTLARKEGFIGSVAYLTKILRLLPRLKGYDVVQLINPGFLNLRPEKLKRIFDYLKHNNRSIFLTLAGDDHYFIKASVDGIFRFSEMKVGDNPTDFALSRPDKIKEWLDKKLAEYTNYIYRNIDGAVAILPEYHIAAQITPCKNITFIPLHINVGSLEYSQPDINGKIRIMVGIRRGDSRELQKGSLILADTAKNIAAEFPDKCEAVIIENVPLQEYLGHLSRSHIILDQLYAYSPATNALQGMALGKVVGSGAQPEYYDYICEPDKGGILTLTPENNLWIEQLRNFIMHPELMINASVEARRLIEKHHDVRTAAIQYLNFWNSNLQ